MTNIRLEVDNGPLEVKAVGDQRQSLATPRPFDHDVDALWGDGRSIEPENYGLPTAAEIAATNTKVR